MSCSGRRGQGDEVAAVALEDDEATEGIDAGFEFEVVGGPILAADGVADALSCSLPHGKIREKKSNPG